MVKEEGDYMGYRTSLAAVKEGVRVVNVSSLIYKTLEYGV